MGKFVVLLRGFLWRMSLRIRILMPWSASEQDSGVDSGKPRMNGVAIKKD
jgi:hypothetical protein